jgi:hypothetical protein
METQQSGPTSLLWQDGIDFPDSTAAAFRVIGGAATAVPESDSLAIFGAGLAMLGVMRRKCKAS